MLDIKCFVFESCFLKSSFLDMQVRLYGFNFAYFSDHWITWCLKFFNYCCDKLIYQVFLLRHKSQTAVSSWKKVH